MKHYHSFTGLVNHAMEKLRGRGEFVLSFCQNDLIFNWPYSERKSDSTGVEKDVFNESERRAIGNFSKGGPIGNAFFWTDLLSCLEFNVRAFILSPGKTLPLGTTGLALMTLGFRVFLIVGQSMV
jgi:hypothetical protein